MTSSTVQHSTLRRRIAGTIGALGLIAGTAVLAAPAAQADPLPSGAFKMDIGDGSVCVTADILTGTLYDSPCSALNLAQNFYYDATNGQIELFGGLSCLGSGAEGAAIVVEACNNSDTGQRWEVDSVGTAGGRVITLRDFLDPATGVRAAMTFGASATVDYSLTYYNPDYEPSDSSILAQFRSGTNQPL